MMEKGLIKTAFAVWKAHAAPAQLLGMYLSHAQPLNPPGPVLSPAELAHSHKCPLSQAS